MPTFNQFLRQLGTGDNVRDYAHASRTFVDGGTYRLAPKQKFLFYVVFNINPVRTSLSNLEKREISTLVKSVTLPNLSIDTSDLNQYNRHKHVQTKINYQAVSIKFHDDSNNTINKLWIDYYSYYYADTMYPENEYYYGPEIQSSDRAHVGWGLDNGSIDPFFNNIKIYSLHQKKFTEYTLINPIIKSFSHDSHDYSEGTGLLENSMDVEYEAVKYATGSVKAIKGFGELHYDTTPSPLSPAGGGTESFFGPGGLLDSGSSVISDLASGNLIGAVLSGASLYNNASNMNMKGAITEELSSIGNQLLRGQNPTSKFAFPVAGAVNNLVAPISSTAYYEPGATVNSGLATSNGSGLAVPSTMLNNARNYALGGVSGNLQPSRLVGGSPTLNTKR